MRGVGALVLIPVIVMFIKYIFFDRHDYGNGLDISALEKAWLITASVPGGWDICF